MTSTPHCSTSLSDRATDPVETELVARLRAGDNAAYGRLVRENAQRLTATARGFLTCEDECADAVQDAFVSAFRSIDSFEGTSRLGTWLHRIVVNHCLMRLRKRKRTGSVSLDAVGSDAFGRVVPPSDRLERNELAVRVQTEVDHLPAGYRVIIRLRDLEGLDTDQTAARLGMSRAAVKTRLHRARTALRLALDDASLPG